MSFLDRLLDPNAPKGSAPVIPFLDHLGVVLEEKTDHRAVIQLTLKPWMLNSFGVGHGGVVMTLLDVAMALSGRQETDDLATGNITIEMKTTFMAPANSHELKAIGTCIKRTGRMAFCEAELFDHAGQLIAKASGTFRRTQQPSHSIEA